MVAPSIVSVPTQPTLTLLLPAFTRLMVYWRPVMPMAVGKVI